MVDLVDTTLGQYEIIKLWGRGEIVHVCETCQRSLRPHAALVVLPSPVYCVADFIQSFQDDEPTARGLAQCGQ